MTTEEIDPAAQLQFILDNEDTHAALGAIGYLREWLDEIEENLVLQARVEGLSWHGIAQELRRSKQAVWERHHDGDPRDTEDG